MTYLTRDFRSAITEMLHIVEAIEEHNGLVLRVRAHLQTVEARQEKAYSPKRVTANAHPHPNRNKNLSPEDRIDAMVRYLKQPDSPQTARELPDTDYDSVSSSESPE